MSGIEYLRAMLSGQLPHPPMGELLAIRPSSVEHGKVVLVTTPDASMYNPIGTVHGGVLCTLLDSALGCAVQSTLPRGVAYTSIEIKVTYVRPVTATSGPLTATGRVTKEGRRICFAEGDVTDAAGRTVATATSSLLIMPLD